jgi:hypothetical protein
MVRARCRSLGKRHLIRERFDARIDRKGDAILEDVYLSWALRSIRQLLGTSKASSRACCNTTLRCGQHVSSTDLKSH